MNLTATYYVQTCCNCHIHFAVPDDWDTQRRRDHVMFYCPNGHPQHYTAKSDLDILRAEKLRLESQVEFERGRKYEIAGERDEAQRKLRATKGVVTRYRKRAENGVCIYCTRTFSDLARHMKCKHQEQLKADGVGNESAQ